MIQIKGSTLKWSLWQILRIKNFMGTSSRFLAESLSLQESTITHQLVLVGCDSCEDSLNEDEGAELLRFEIEQRGSVVLLFYDVDPWLVFVHGVEDDLQRTRRARISLQ